jgi:hypothetical protein
MGEGGGARGGLWGVPTITTMSTSQTATPGHAHATSHVLDYYHACAAFSMR